MSISTSFYFASSLFIPWRVSIYSLIFFIWKWYQKNAYNPTASVLTIEELGKWVELALKYDFVLLNDECYSELYFDEKPASILEACKKVGNENFKNVLVINSISKRSSAPGLRSGFIAGDKEILKDYSKYRTYIG